MKRSSLFTILTTLLVILVCFSALTACGGGEQTLNNLKNEYGIAVEGGSFPEGSTLVAKPIDETSNEGKAALQAIEGQEYNVFKPVYIFDISVVLDNAEIQPNGKVKVSIPVTANLAEYKAVLHIKDNGTVERLSATYADGKVSFETDGFSVFVLVDPVKTHVHTFSSTWSFDETNHWHAATCEHTSEKSDEGKHVWDEGTEIKPATEKEDGQIKYVCTICGGEKFETVRLHKHTFSDEWLKDETYHWHAATCEHTSEKDAYGEHAYGEPWNEKDPTETETGVSVRVCITCKWEQRTEIPKLDHVHTFSKDWTGEGGYHWHAATCSHTTETSGKAPCSGGNATCSKKAVCSVCGNEYGDLSAHDFTAKVRSETHLATPATCKSHAYYYYSCTACGKNGTETFEDTTGNFAYCTYDETEICTVCKIPAGDWLTYELRADGDTYKVTSSQVPYNRTIEYVLVPSTYNGKPVIEIDEQALYYSRVKHIELSDNIQILGGNSPLSANLETLTIGKGLRVIEQDSLGYGTGAGGTLRQITISEDNPYFKTVDGVMYSKDGKTLVKYPGLREGEEFTIGSNVEKIWGYAFESTQNLKKVVIPDSVTEIMPWAFNLSSITSVSIGAGVKTIPEYAFASSKLKSLQLDGNVSTIEGNAFSYCADLQTVTFGAKVKTIKTQAFIQCIKLTEIIIPDTVTKLESYVFAETSSVKSIVIGSGIDEIPDYAFSSSTINVAKPTVTIGSNVKKIGQFAFENVKVESITIPAGVKSIGQGAFKGCAKLKSIVIPNTVEEILEGAFQDCTVLESATLSTAITEIFAQTFYRCRALESITIPNNVKTIGVSAFFACTAMETVTFGTGLKTICNNAFENCYKLTSITLPDGVEEIQHEAFKGCETLKTVVLPSSVRKISNVTFKNCTALESVTFADTTDKELYIEYDKIYTYTFDTVEKTIAMLSGKVLTRNNYLYNIWAYNEDHPYDKITQETIVTRWEDRETA